MNREQFSTLLEVGLQYGASDIHFRPNEPPGYRVHGAFSHLKHDRLSVTDTEAIASLILAEPALIEALHHIRQIDRSFGVANLGRFRAHIYRQRGNLALVLRVIPAIVSSIDQLGLPPILKDLTGQDRGLVLVAGPSSSGKTTSLAAMVDHINRTYRHHIVTIEQPIEFIHTTHQSSVSQREIGRDTESLADALSAVQRQDPDVIMIGTLQTATEIELALAAAESGKLVLSGVNANDATQVIQTLAVAFPADQGSTIRNRIAMSLKAVIAQKLLRRADGKAMVAATEIFLATLKARELIKDASRQLEIVDLIDRAGDLGMHSMDAHIAQLLQAGQISREVAFANANNRTDFERRLTLG